MKPLNAAVVEIKFPADVHGAIIEVHLQDCDNTGGTVGDIVTCQLQKQKLLHSKIYVEGESNCQITRPPDGGIDPHLEGWRHITGISSAKRYFIVVANADTKDPHGFSVLLEPQS